MTELDAAQILFKKFSPAQMQAWAKKELASGEIPSLDEYVSTYLRESIWSLQKAICDSVDKNRRTAVPSCHGAGKSFIASRVASAWLGRYPPGEAFVVTSAPSFPQVKAILWREINKCFTKNKKILPGRVNQTEWYIDNELIAFGRKPQDMDPAAFQGIHAKYLLVIFDEASGMPNSLWDAANTLTTNERSRFLAIGNPDDPESQFAKNCEPGSGWNVIRIPAFVTPNFTGEELIANVKEDLTTPMWVKERADEWGTDSPLYIAKVLAQFPKDTEDGVVPGSKVAKCRIPKDHKRTELTPVHLGVDVGAGGDATVIRERRGVKAGRVWRNRSRDSETVVALVIKAVKETGAVKVRIDSQGIGWGVVGHVRSKLRELGLTDVRVIKVNVSSKSTKPLRFPKLRDQLWWEVGRQLSVDGVWDLSECDDSTINQLLSVKYEIDSAGRVKVEPKDETKKRLKRSPDDADALLLAFYDGRGAGADFMDAWLDMLKEQGRDAEIEAIEAAGMPS